MLVKYPIIKLKLPLATVFAFFMLCFLLLPFMVMMLLMLYMHLQMSLVKVQYVSMWDKLVKNLKKQCFTKIYAG